MENPKHKQNEHIKHILCKVLKIVYLCFIRLTIGLGTNFKLMQKLKKKHNYAPQTLCATF